MSVQKAIRSNFSKMNTDTSQNRQDNNSFYDALNFRLLTDEALSNGALINFKGTKARFKICSQGGPNGYNTSVLKGYSFVGDYMILFLYDENNSYSYISKAEISTESFTTVSTAILLYSDLDSNTKLNFNTVDNISTQSRDENDFSKKVYFSVFEESLRVINIVDPPELTDDASILDIIPNNNGGNIVITDLISGGLLQAGKIQYAYRLFKKYGAETTFSATSELYSLTSSYPKNTAEYTGSDLEEDIGKSIRLSVSDIDTSFDYINIYSIFYSEKGLPIISLITEREISTDSIIHIDNGSVLETITVEEFNSFGGRLFSAKVLKQKNNMLFAANIIEDNIDIDIDCRAYRFNASGVARVYEDTNDINYHYTITSSGAFSYYSPGNPIVTGVNWELPKTANCINYYNDEFRNQEADTYGNFEIYPYKYKKSDIGVHGFFVNVLGGAGPVVSYEIKLSDDIIQLTSNYNTVVNTTNEKFILSTSSHKQGETYRYGLTFFDLKGKPYFTKWIGDIRIPYLDIFNIQSEYISTQNIIIEFSVDLTNIDQSILNTVSGFRPSRVERTTSDKSVLAQGVTWGVGKQGVLSGELDAKSVYYHSVFPMGIDSTGAYSGLFYPNWEGTSAYEARKNYLHPLYSPEFMYNGGIDISSSEVRFKILNIIHNDDTDPVTNPFRHVCLKDTRIYSTSYIGEFSATRIIFPVYTKDSIVVNSKTMSVGQDFSMKDSFKLTRQNQSTGGIITSAGTTSDPIEFKNRVLPDTVNDSPLLTMFGPTSALFISNSPIYKYFKGVSATAYTVDVYVNNFLSRYGGNLYIDRLNNDYAIIGEFVKVNGAGSYNTSILNGDVYNTIYDSITSYADPTIEDNSDKNYMDNLKRRQVCLLFPLESSINCTLSNIKPSKYVLVNKYASGINQDSDYIALQETTSYGIELYGDKYPTTLPDLNSYNTAYSSTPIYPTGALKPILWEAQSKLPYTIIASEIKANGELIDSWTKFLYANLLDVESNYGDIHGLETLNNKLYYFQENAIGIAAVNDRYLLNTGDEAKLALGTGGILERFDYIKYNEGILTPECVINTSNNIYYIDGNRKVINSLSSKNIALSTQQGINSIFRSLYTDKNTHVALGYNTKYKEVMMTIDDKTLVFNENTNSFAPRHSTVPIKYLNSNNLLLSYIEDEDSSLNDRYIYQHDAGERGEVYYEGYLTQSVDSNVTFIVNPRVGNINVFDYIEFNTEIYEDGNNMGNGFDLVDDTFNTLVCKNTYQSESKSLVIDTSLIRQTSEFDFTVNTSRRGRYWRTQIPTTSEGNRFADTTIMITLNYPNNDNKLFKLQDIINYYRSS